MEIKTKFNIGDKVWIMRDNKPENIRIDGVQIGIRGKIISGSDGRLYGKPYTEILYVEQRKNYGCSGDIDPIYFHNERGCFGTKKELLDSFLNDGE